MDRVLRSAKAALKPTPQPTANGTSTNNKKGQGLQSFPKAQELIQTSYTSDPVDLPPSFLATTDRDRTRITAHKINFAENKLPEYKGCFAAILEDVLTPEECAELIQYAEQSAESSGKWRPALINAGGNLESLQVDYRNSDRIIWDDKEVAGRLWERCRGAELSEGKTLEDEIGLIQGDGLAVKVLGEHAALESKQRWRLSRLNERLRFLRYQPGHFFDTHCDGSYVNPNPREGVIAERTLITLHLYLTSSDDGLQGGATGFYSRKSFYDDTTPDYQVKAKPGRVLLFQHRGLYHAGEEVLAGEKFTMRSDLLYECF